MARLDDFKREHPVCAFCAGENPTTSQDHQPGRVFFRNKRFADAIAVPACDMCQRVSRRAEVALSLAVLPVNPSERDFSDWQKRVAYARKHHPELIPQVPQSTREARRIATQLGIRPPRGMFYKDLPLALLEPEDYKSLFDIFARKLTLANFYRCFKRPLSRDGAMYARVVPNAHIAEGEWLGELIGDLPQCEVPVHGNEDLGDQILTRWHASEDGHLGMFITKFQDSMVVIGLVGESARWREFVAEMGKSQFPFYWDNS